MAESFSVSIENLDAVRAALAKWEGSELDAKLKKGVQSGGRAIAKGIRATIPHGAGGTKSGFKDQSKTPPGTLYRSIKSKTLRGSPPAVAVGPMARYRHLAIRPTRAHILLPVGSAFLAIGTGGLFREVVHHPGNKAHPWVDAGINAKHDAAIQAAGKAIFKAIEESE